MIPTGPDVRLNSSYQRNVEGTNFGEQPVEVPCHVATVTVSVPTKVGVRVKVHSAGEAPVCLEVAVMAPVAEATANDATYCVCVVEHPA